MATSPNYGWLEPDNTDLVKNGALAIRTLGNAIDTTMATMTPKSIVDAKGDLIAASAADTPARLAVGNNGETLVADSSTATGLRYTAGTVQANPVLNSAMQVWQRSTSVAVAANTVAYTADRWQIIAGVSQATTVSRQATNDTTNLPNIQYCARVQRNSGQTGTSTNAIYNVFESINSIPYAGKNVTISFYARAGANYSPTSNILIARLLTGTGTDQNPLTGGFTGSSFVIDQNATLTTTWQRFTYTGTVGTTATQLAIGFAYNWTGTAGTNDYFEVTGVQLDIGSVALPFRTYSGTIQGELAACQRYYWRANAGSSTQSFGTGASYATTTAFINVQNPVSMRVAPTSIEYSTLAINSNAFNAQAVTALTLDYQGTYSNLIKATVAANLTAGSGAVLFANGSTSAYIGFSAEL